MGTKMGRQAYEQLIAEDLAWLLSQLRTLERDHIADIVRLSPDREYGPQAEASEELETRDSVLRQRMRLCLENERLRAELSARPAPASEKALREALEHYADESLYFPRNIVLECQHKGIELAPIYSDFGEIARAALATPESAGS